jgi:hypothetical protein
MAEAVGCWFMRVLGDTGLQVQGVKGDSGDFLTHITNNHNHNLVEL